MDYFIGDFHAGDENIIRYFKRPFIDASKERRILVENWISTIQNNDTVFILGDIGDDSILNELNGNIVVVIGNHDNYDVLKRNHPNMEISRYPIMYNGIWASHEPITYIPPECPYLNIHAHTHTLNYGQLGCDWKTGNRYFNASADVINFTPISILQIASQINYN